MHALSTPLAGGLYVAATTRTGQGLFTEAPLLSGTCVHIVSGRICVGDYDQHYRVGRRWLGVGPNRWLVPEAGDAANYVNHSCDANCTFTDRARIIALRMIPAHAEVTIDYATTEWDPFWRMTCKCGAPPCRRLVRAANESRSLQKPLANHP